MVEEKREKRRGTQREKGKLLECEISHANEDMDRPRPLERAVPSHMPSALQITVIFCMPMRLARGVCDRRTDPGIYSFQGLPPGLPPRAS